MSKITTGSNTDRLTILFRVVQNCHACPRMEGRRRVLSTKNGKVSAKVMFIAEAPGRNGADRTGIPIHGDPTGVNFERLLSHIGWSRNDVFVTNAVLCNPRNDEGNNDTPTEFELCNCSIHLESTINIVNPVVIAPLGAKALQALSLISHHDFVLSKVVATTQEWNDRLVFPLYHPSPRVLVHRSMAKQRHDFSKLKEVVELNTQLLER